MTLVIMLAQGFIVLMCAVVGLSLVLSVLKKVLQFVVALYAAIIIAIVLMFMWMYRAFERIVLHRKKVEYDSY